MLRKNIFFNYLGSLWVAMMAIAFVPLYIKYLGAEGYGLVGFFSTLSAWFVILDLGMTPTINREAARFTAETSLKREFRAVFATFEFIACILAICVAALGWITSDWVAEHWLNPNTVTKSEISSSLFVMGVIIALRLWEGIYRGCLLGLMFHGTLNAINMLIATLRPVGALIVLIFISNDVLSFFLWQVVVSFLSLVLHACIVHLKLPKQSPTPRPSFNAIRGLLAFSTSIIGASALQFASSQSDKVLLSLFVPLSEYGIYMFSTAVTGALIYLVSPIATSFFPYLSAMIAKKDIKEFSQSFNYATQLVTCLTGSAAISICLYSYPLLLFWTQNEELSASSASLVSLLVISSFLSALSWIPVQAQLANGSSDVLLRVSSISTALGLTAIPVGTIVAEGQGAAIACIVVSFVSFFSHVVYLQQRIRDLKIKQWLYESILLPMLFMIIGAISLKTSFAAILAVYLNHPSTSISVCVALFLSFFTFSIGLVASKILRFKLTRMVKKLGAQVVFYCGRK